VKRHLDVWINNMSLRDADPRIIITNIRDNPPEIETTFGQYAGRHGQRIMSQFRVQREIGVDFRLKELYSLSARQKIIDAVCAWAQPGYLTTSLQPEKRIYVHVTAWPGVVSARDYTEEFSVEFTASAQPFWEDIAAQACVISGAASGAGTLANLGNQDAVCDVEATVTNGTLTSFSAQVGETSIELANLSVAAGGKVAIRHDEFGNLMIYAGGVSALSKRTAQSADELIAAPGRNDVTITADATVSVTVSARGRYR